MLEPLGLDTRPEALGGASVADVLLEPTVIYVRAVLELLRSGLPVHGLAHITGGGLANLLRLGDGVGWAIESPLPVPAVFDLIRDAGGVPEAELWDVFNMGCGFVAVVPEAAADEAVALLAAHHPGSGADRHRHRRGRRRPPARAGVVVAGPRRDERQHRWAGRRVRPAGGLAGRQPGRGVRPAGGRGSEFTSPTGVKSLPGESAWTVEHVPRR